MEYGKILDSTGKVINSDNQSNPRYRDKEERRLVVVESLNNLIEFHKVERDEKFKTLTFYSVFLTGGIAIAFGIPYLIKAELYQEHAAKIALSKLIAIISVATFNLLAIKKLIAIRVASNNIYREYGKRLKYLMEYHQSDCSPEEKSILKNAFQKYYGDIETKREILPEYSIDKYEVYGLFFITVIFSFSCIIPFSEFCSVGATELNQLYLKQLKIFSPLLSLAATIISSLLFISAVVWFGFYIIQTSDRSRGAEPAKDEVT